MHEAYVVAALRTAGGTPNGSLSGWHPADLAARVLDALIKQVGCDPALVDDVILGCGGRFGEQSGNIGRESVLASRLPESVPGFSLDRQCGSSQQALHVAAQAVMSGSMGVVIAGGVERLIRIPMTTLSALDRTRGVGHCFSQGIQARYPGVAFSQLDGAERMAEKYGLSRERLEEFALLSHRRAAMATRVGRFEEEIVPVPVRGPQEVEVYEVHGADDGVHFDASLEAMAGLKPLTHGGRCTAATASQICDGASAVMVVNERGLKAIGVPPLARIHHLSVMGHDPVVMLEAPIPATARALHQAGLKLGQIDLFEINEAFASVPLAWLQATGADPQRLNVNGGALALGHPRGAAGARLACTLIHALHQRGERYGLQSMSEIGGMANVTIFERL